MVSGAAGVQSHTHTVWKLLRRRGIPHLSLSIKWICPARIEPPFLRNCGRSWTTIVWILHLLIQSDWLSAMSAFGGISLYGAVTEARIAAAISRCRVFR